MSLPRSSQVTDEYGRGVPGATIYVFNADGTTAATFSDAGLSIALAQPVSTDQFGGYTYYAADGFYTEEIWYGGKLRERDRGIPVGAAIGTLSDEAVLRTAGDAAEAVARNAAILVETNNRAGAVAIEAGARVAGDASLLTLIQNLPSVAAHISDLHTYTAASFGLVGDGDGNGGGTDNYAAFVAMASALSGTRLASMQLDPGKIYRIGQHHTATNNVNPITILNAVGLTFNGNGAKLDFDGSFDRSVSTTAAIGLVFQACSKLRVHNLEIDGNVDQTTNSSSSVESAFSYGLRILGCTDVDLVNVESHHNATDGILVAQASGIASKNVKALNCWFHHNARMGATGDGLQDVVWEMCRFTDQGRASGTYGHHAPNAGWDWEPTQALSLGNLDIQPNNVRFKYCRFANNFGADILSVSSATSSDISVDKCHIEASADANSTSTIIIGISRAELVRSYLDMSGHRLELSPGTDATGTHEVDDNDILGSSTSNFTLYSAIASKGTWIRRNRLKSTATGPTSFGMIGLSQPAVVWDENEVFIPAAKYSDGGTTDQSTLAEVSLSGRRARRNRYTTDLTAAAGSSGTAHFWINYNSTPAYHERFAGTAVGAADTFRPIAGGSFDTTYTYSVGDGFIGHPGFGAVTDAAKTLTLASHKVQQLDVALTAARALTLPAPGNVGRRFRVVRTANGTGAFNLNINTSGAVLVKALTGASTWAEVEDDGTQYRLIASGAL